MVRRMIATLTAALVLAGCAQVRPSDPAAPGVDLEDINSELAGRVVLLKLVDGSDLVADDVRISPDSLHLRPRDVSLTTSPGATRVARALPISEVRAIEVSCRGRGQSWGALIGLGAGSIAGAAIGHLATYEGSGLGENALLGALFFGVLGTGAGFLIGAIVGSKDVYDLTRAPVTAQSGLSAAEQQRQPRR